MLDVHAPEHRLSTTRDFFIHLITITVGLLIALGLENSVEALHHRHQRKEAERLIREELTQNQKDLTDSAAGLKTEIDNMHKIVSYVEARAAGKDGDATGLSIAFSEGSLADSAWRTASSTGVLSYMDYTEVQHFSDAYKEQDLLQKTAEEALDDYLHLASFVKDQDGHLNNLSQEDAVSSLPYVRSALGHLSGMYFIGQGTMGSYKVALK